MPTAYIPGTTTSGYFGSIRGTNGTYAVARSTSNTLDTTSTELVVGQARYDAGTYFVSRMFVEFDLGSYIPSGAILQSAAIRLVSTGDQSAAANFNIYIKKCSYAVAMAGGNREANYDLCLSSDLDVTWRSTSGMSVNTQYTSPDVDLTRLTVGQPVRYGIMSSRDTNSTVTGSDADEYIYLASPAHANADYRPTLIVQYLAMGGTATITGDGSAAVSRAVDIVGSLRRRNFTSISRGF